MAKKILTIAMLTALVVNSCKEAPKQENAETSKTETVKKTADEIVKNSSTDKNGKKIEMSFNNTKDIVTVNFNGETFDLVGQRTGSGIWYKNENYELRGKGNDVELTKDGKVVFEHKDDIVETSLKNKKGETLNMIFNNTTNQANIYLNDGKQIELVEQKTASGIWYKNNHYELTGKGENLVLKKDGKTIFEK